MEKPVSDAAQILFYNTVKKNRPACAERFLILSFNERKAAVGD